MGLDGLTDGPHLMAPRYLSLSEDEQQVALSAALRGLTARGVNEATPHDAESREFSWTASEYLQSVLELRRSGDRLVILGRRPQAGLGWFTAISHAEVWLTEVITTTGYHDLRLTAASLGSTVLDRVFGVTDAA